MKALKVIGILILVIVALGLIASLVLPKDMVVTESITIEAPIDVVWNNVSSWEKIDKWSPWYGRDNEMKVTFEGEPGTLTSKYLWNGNNEVGSGHQLFTLIDPENHTVETEVAFKEPWEGTGNAAIVLSDDGEGKTKVTWNYNQHSGIPFNLMSALYDAKGMLSHEYSLGLAKLKEIAEEDFKNIPVVVNYAVYSENREAKQYAGNRVLIKQDSMHGYFQTYMPLIGQAFETSNMAMGGAPSALYFKWLEETKETELTVAIPLTGNTAPEGYQVYEIPAGEYLVIDYYGSYDKIGDAHNAMYAYSKENGYTIPENGVVIEEYLTVPGMEAEGSPGLTKIVYPAVKIESPE